MDKELLDTPEKRNQAVSAFSSLVNNEGWQLLEKFMQADIDVLTKQIVDGEDRDGRSLTIEETDLLREMRTLYIKIKEYPRKIAESFSKGETEPVQFDVYETEKEIRERRLKRELERNVDKNSKV